jgi:hypothetical protein
MERSVLIFSILLLIGLSACRHADPRVVDPVIYLENGPLKAGILHGVGGRLVYLSFRGGENLLKSDSTLWTEAPGERPRISPESGFKAYNGHIIWPGPQSQWWTRQDMNPDRKQAGALWPPDPYLIYSPYRLVDLTDSSLCLKGPGSPVSGISLVKQYRLGDDFLEIEVEMINTSDSSLAWDIWSNARFDGRTSFIVPGCADGIGRIMTEDSDRSGRLDWENADGAFTFLTRAPSGEQTRRYAKAYLYPEKGRMVAVREHCMIIMHFDEVEKERIHPEQGFVEIYRLVTPDGKEDLLELEHHSAYTDLEPGASMVMKERWTFHPFEGPRDTRGILNCYEQVEQER